MKGPLPFITLGETCNCCYFRRAAHFANYAAEEDEDAGAVKGKEVSCAKLFIMLAAHVLAPTARSGHG